MSKIARGPQAEPATVEGGPKPSAQPQAPGGAKLLTPGWMPLLRKPGGSKPVVPGSEPF